MFLIYVQYIQEDTIIFSVFDQLQNQALDTETVVSRLSHTQWASFVQFQPRTPMHDNT